MLFYVFAGLFSACGILFLLAKMNFKRVLWLDVPIDMASTALLVVLFFGTFAGMMAAAIGGAVISIVLFATKRTIGYQKPKWNKYKFEWVNVPPR
jgi:cellulose synthase/poly-beta-1,6-N-acetylglucosamine synthase-like glycosyltransferase